MNKIVIEVPTEKLDTTINNSINRGERHFRQKKSKKVAAAACILACSFSLFNFTKPASAESIPLIGTVIEHLNNSLGINKDSKDYEKYAQRINKTSKDNGIEIKVTEAILDDHDNLILSYEMKNEKEFTVEEKEYFQTKGVGIQLDGIKRVSFQPNYNIAPDKAAKVLPALSKDGKMLDLQETNGSIHGKFINNNTFIGIGQYNLSSFKSVPNNFKMKVDIDKIKFFSAVSNDQQEIYAAPASINGTWNLEFEVKKSTIKEAKTVKPNIKSEYVTVKAVTITPFTADVSVQIDFSKINKLKIIDENNIEYTNYGTIDKKENDPKFSEITFRFMDIKNDVKSLKLIFLNNKNEEVFSCPVNLQGGDSSQ